MTKDVRVRVVRSDGEEFTVGTGTRWAIPKDGLENWANLPINVEVNQSVGFDGGTVASKRVESTDRSVTAVLRDTLDIEGDRMAAVRFFNPKYSYEAHIEYQGRALWCQGEQLGFKCDAINVYEPVTLTWTIICPMPYLMSEDNFGRDLADVEPRFGFEFRSAATVAPEADGKVNRGFIWSAFAFARNVEVVNDGDVETFCRVYVVASGAVKNPKIVIGGKFVSYKGTMKEGDVLELDFVSRPPTLKLNGKNVINKADRKSTFVGMSLNVGETIIQYMADEGDNLMSVSFYYNKRYLGV